MLPSDPLFHTLSSAVRVLRQGGIVALPTESSYGLAVDVYNERALRRLYHVKQRAEEKPLLVLVNSREGVAGLVREIPFQYKRLMAQFWPGPLTLIFPAAPQLSSILTGGSETVGVRHSPYQLASALVDNFGGPITATSANLSGKPPCTSAKDVEEIFGNGVDMIIDGGDATGKPSTIVTLKRGELTVLREGQLPAELFHPK